MIGVLFNTEPSRVKKRLRWIGYTLKMVELDSPDVPLENVVIGLKSVEALQYKTHSFKKGVLLWESVSKVKSLSFDRKVCYLDSELKNNGLVTFTPLNFLLLKQVIKSDWREPKKCKFNYYLNDFLKTLPLVTHEPFIVSLVSSIEENDYSIVYNFLGNNRLITDKNNKVFLQFNRYLTRINIYIQYIAQRDKEKLAKIKNLHLKKSLNKIRFLIFNFGTALEDFLDHEQTLSPTG